LNNIDYNSPEYKRSRKAYMAQCTFEYFICLLVADAFLAKLLEHLGLSDSAIGIVSSFISLVFIIQLAAIPLVKAKISTKKLVLTLDTLSQVFFMFMYVIPFLPIAASGKKVLVVLSILLAYVFKYIIVSIYFKWANSYVEPHKRGVYSAVKEMISLVLGIVFTMVIGYVFDRYESIGNINGGFIFIAFSMLVINICNFICLLMIKKEDKTAKEEENTSFKEVMKNIFAGKGFRNVLIFMMLFKFSTYFTIGFLGIFKTKDLLLSTFVVQVINMVANLFRVAVSIPFGKFSDKYSFAKGFELALFIGLGAYLCLMFTTPSTWVLIIAFTVLHNISIAGTNQNSFNIMYSYVDSKYITQAMAISNCIGGTFGFIGSLIGGRILSYVQANGNSIFGIPMYGQQFMAFVSAIFMIASLAVIHFGISKEKVKVQ